MRHGRQVNRHDRASKCCPLGALPVLWERCRQRLSRPPHTAVFLYSRPCVTVLPREAAVLLPFQHQMRQNGLSSTLFLTLPQLWPISIISIYNLPMWEQLFPFISTAPNPFNWEMNRGLPCTLVVSSFHISLQPLQTVLQKLLQVAKNIVQFFHGCFSKCLSVVHHKHNSVPEHSTFDSHLTNLFLTSNIPTSCKWYFFIGTWSGDFDLFLISFQEYSRLHILTSVLLTEKVFFYCWLMCKCISKNRQPKSKEWWFNFKITLLHKD